MTVKVSAERRVFKAPIQRGASSFAAANRLMWFGFHDGSIIRSSAPSNPSDAPTSSQTTSDSITLRLKHPGTSYEVQSLFVDSKSFHCIASLSSGQHCYSNFQSHDLIALTTLRGCFIRSVCFTDATSEDVTGSFLLGTERGSLIEGRINYRRASYSFRTLYTLPGGEPVLDIGIVPIVLKGCRTQVIVALSTCCLYEFIGGTSIEETISRYANNGKSAMRYEVPLAGPSGQILISERSDGSHDLFWANAAGIVYVNIPYRVSDDSTSCLSFPPTVIPYPSSPSRPLSSLQDSKLRQVRTFLRRPAVEVPRSTVVLSHSLLLLFDEKLIVVNTIVGKPVATLLLPTSTFGKAHQLVSDRLSGETWLHTSEGIFAIVVRNESDDVWKHYLFNGDIKNALSTCKTPAQRDSVLLKGAYDQFERGNYIEAARLYGQVESNQPDFELICMKFLEKSQDAAVLEYVMLKIQHRNWFRYDPRFIILTVWVIEMLGYRYKDMHLTMDVARDIQGIDMSSLTTLRQEYRNKLFTTMGSLAHLDDMANPISYLLQTVMGCGDECVEFARLRRDPSNAICYLISSGNIDGAFTELLQMPPGDKRDALILRFAPLLFLDAPELFARASFSGLDPTLLLPVALLPLMMHNAKYLPHSIGIMERLLFHGVTNHGEPTQSLLWCCYIMLLSNMESSKTLLDVLSRSNIDFSHSDLAIALRYLKTKSAKDSRWVEPFIVLQSLCGMNEDALELALSQGNIELAAQCAMRPSDDFTRRRLWRYILRHSALTGGESLNSIFEAAKGLLHVHDLLQFLPEGTQLAEMSDVIAKYVAEYEEHLSARRQEVDHLCSFIAEAKSEMQAASRRSISLPISAECISCGTPLHTSQFIVFPCSHAFHRACIAATLRKLLKGYELSELQRLHNAFEKRSDEHSVKKYNEFLSKSCVICSYPSSTVASKPFFSSVDDDQSELWAIS
ncbi:Pep3/Vps18/deep orange vacuolar protein sorting-associated family protein [Babesia bovis T2Bo]|uniref:Pep3/Vps18/deep orange family protein n=1 Tax=Babesia bovis TaxID=5865 RepID=A7APY9_BABBO|nr:Pep3/Vps18/deep orange vacuolar protein sorting-associated family protein [Babesia bovis T2Bo]EDO08623.1 Pep3/Vps18/deep orange vacuolar protein sorting-associated family protein [Babesia bovis T2Bo]|eukprot:XP_001612191.1 Pep3/Vps18/deep orange family protein [Babesia bovis T2Bo]